MTNKLRNSGFLFASVFFLGYLINIPVVLSHGGTLYKALFMHFQPITLAASGLFLASALVAKLRWLQPALALGLAPLAIIPEPESVFGLGFFILGALLLERAGFMKKRQVLTAGLLTAYLIVLEVASVFYAKHPVSQAVTITFFILAFALFLWYLYKDKLVIVIKEPKPSVSLAEKGLAPAERLYTMALIKGRSPKEIAADFGVSISTVRTTLVRAYRKLEVEDAFELLALSITHEVVE
jgi:DNA-binding CsgD family transcriptional regulator